MDAFLEQWKEPESQQLTFLKAFGAKVYMLHPHTWVAVIRGWWTLPESEFQALWDSHPEEFPTVVMQGREVKLPRWSVAYGRDYEYSHAVAKAEPPTELIQELMQAASEACLAPFNQCLCNWYRPDHYVGPHQDNTRPLVWRSPIAALSLGATRRFRLKPVKEGREMTIEVRDGDLVVMGGACQETHRHEIMRDGALGNRVSFTFRCFKE